MDRLFATVIFAVFIAPLVSGSTLQVGNRFPLGININGTNATCESSADYGLLRFENNVMEYCNGTHWNELQSSAIQSLNVQLVNLRDQVENLDCSSCSSGGGSGGCCESSDRVARMMAHQFCNFHGDFDDIEQVCVCNCDTTRGCWDPEEYCTTCAEYWSGSKCQEADECSLGTHDCDGNATCADTTGSYTCTCNSGYAGDGWTCEVSPLGTAVSPALSCLHLQTFFGVGNVVSGEYFLSPDGGTPFETYCDMDHDGGGWTLMASYYYDADNNIVTLDPGFGRQAYGSPSDDFFSSRLKGMTINAVAVSRHSSTSFSVSASDFHSEALNSPYSWTATEPCANVDILQSNGRYAHFGGAASGYGMPHSGCIDAVDSNDCINFNTHNQGYGRLHPNSLTNANYRDYPVCSGYSNFNLSGAGDYHRWGPSTSFTVGPGQTYRTMKYWVR